MATAAVSDLVAGATAVARQHRRALSAPHTQQAAARGELLTFTDDAGCVVAFADYHLRRDGQATIYTIATAADQQGRGYGTSLLVQLAALDGCRSLLAKCPADLPANGWYYRRGFNLAGLEGEGGPRPLNVWRLTLPLKEGEMSDLIVYQPGGELAAERPAGRDVDGMIAAWLDSKGERSGSDRTAAAYADELTGFRAFLQGYAHADLDAPPDVIALAAQAWCGRPGRRGRPRADGEQPTAAPATATFNQRRAILSSFYTYCNRMGWLAGNPIARVEGRTVHQYATAAAPEAASVKAGLAAIDRSDHAGRRDYALLAVALTTGRRLAELAALSWGDLTVQQSGKGEQISVVWQRAKGGKVMRDLLTVPVSAALLAWLYGWYGAALGDLAADAPVWVSLATRNGTAGRRLSKQGIADVVRARLHTHPHATRHAFARATEKAGAKVSDVQARLGHSSLATTGKYLAALAAADNPYADPVGAMFGFD